MLSAAFDRLHFKALGKLFLKVTHMPGPVKDAGTSYKGFSDSTREIITIILACFFKDLMYLSVNRHKVKSKSVV